MGKSKCELCDGKAGVRHKCEVCHRLFCRQCCKRFLALEENPVKQAQACNECFLEHVAWDASRNYDVYGPAGGKPVVLVHGALVGRQCLVLEARALAEVGFRVIVPDLPAHGARFREHPLTLDSALSTLHEIIQQEAPGRKVVMMGFSMGGYVAAAFAAAYPQLLARVLLGACCHDTHTLSWQLVGRLAEVVYALCSYRTKSQFMYKSFPEVMSPQRVEIQECFLRAGAEFDAWKYVWRVMYDVDMHKLLPKVTCPALLVVGEADYRSHEQKWLSRLQHGSLLVLKGGIHQFMFQPGVCHDFRMHAEGFAAAADWDQPGTGSEGSSTQHAQQPGGDKAAASQPAEGETSSRGSNDQPTVLQPSVPRQPDRVAHAGAGSVGIGAVFYNVLSQFRRGNTASHSNSTSTSCDGWSPAEQSS